MASHPRSMDEVAALLRQNLPAGISPSEFGRRIAWGRGSEEAIERINLLTKADLDKIGLTSENAMQWAAAYEAVQRLMPHNPSARGRGALMRRAADLLSGE